MSVLYHSKCGGVIAAGMPIMLQILTFSVSDKVLIPGSVEIRNTGNKRLEDGSSSPIKFFCTKCQTVIPDRNSMEKEIEILCQFCGRNHPVSECVSTNYTPFVGKTCLEKHLATLEIDLPKQMRRLSVLDILSSNTLTI